MTEDNKDSTPPKLRLSRESAAPDPEKVSAPKPDLKLKRSLAEPQKEKVTLKAPTPPAETPTETEPKVPEVESPEEPAFDPESPFKGIVKEPEAAGRDRPPPELPSKPAPVVDDGSGLKVEEAINQIGENKKSRGLLTSFIVIFILLAVLAGSGYGLYYLLSRPAETKDSVSTLEESDADKAAKKKSDGLLSGPIAKAKATIAKIPGTSSDFEERPSEPEEKPAQAAPEVDRTTATETEKLPAAANSIQTDNVANFLTNAHIGGVRKGNNPKLILNGKSYNKGDLVDPTNELRFVGFKDEKLAFRDAQGIVYIKSF